jgi:hypothetical protein
MKADVVLLVLRTVAGNYRLRRLPISVVTFVFLWIFGSDAFCQEGPFIFMDSRGFGSSNGVGHLELEIGEETAVGRLKFLDDAPPIAVTGRKSSAGALQLEFASSPPRSISFIRRNLPNRVIWDDGSDGSGAMSFWKPLHGPASEAAMLLSDYPCGPQQGAIEAYFRKNVTLADLRKAVAKDSILNNVTAELSVGKRTEHHPLSEVIIRMFAQGRFRNKSSPDAIFIEDGTELASVKRLRSLSNIVAHADLWGGECAGADRAYFIIQKAAVYEGNDFSESKFRSFVQDELTQFLSRTVDGRSFKFSIGAPVARKIRVPPFSTVYKFKVVAASEVTRSEAGIWDRFFVTFEPSEAVVNTANDASVQVIVENLSVSRRSAGNDSPPGDEQFTTREDLDNDEAIITEAIQSHAAHAPNGVYCVYDQLNWSAPAGKASCTQPNQ